MKRFLSVFALLALVAVVAAVLASAGGAQAAPTNSGHKVIAASDAFAGVEGAEKLHDYGTYALYRVSEAVLNETTQNVRVVDEFDRLLIDAYPFNTQTDTLNLPDALRTESVSGGALHLVQFVGPIADQWLSAVEAAGVTPVHYIANNGYLVWADDAGRANLESMVQEGAFLQYSAPFHTYFKLGASIRDRILKIESHQGEVVPVTVQVYDHAGKAETQALVEDLAVEQLSAWSPILNYENAIVRVAAEDLEAIATRPDVTWIGERFERELHDEVQDQIIAGNFNADQSGPDAPGYLSWLDGFGFSQDPADYAIVDVTDDGIGNGTTNSGDPTFHEFGDTGNPTRLAYVANCTAAASGEGVDGHGHINTSIVGGYDQTAGFPYQDPNGFYRGLGVSPYGQIAGTRIFAPFFDLSACGGTDTGLIQSIQDNGAGISSNSWGCSGCAGSYDDSSQAFDVGVRDADLTEAGNQEMMFVFSAGNSGPSGGTVGTPGNGKNMLTVGASENDRPSDEDGSWTDGCGIGPTGADDAMDVIGFSSRGPAPGSRAKPEVIAPGTHIQGTASTNSAYNGSGVCDQYRPSGQTIFAASSGTSHSAPAVSGVSSLVDWWLRNEQPVDGAGSGYTPSPAALKGYIMAHPTYLTGVSANDTLPSNSQGYGMPNMGLMFDDTPKYVLDQTHLFDNSGETWTWNGAVADPSKPVRIILNYTDQAGAIGTSPQVNDLNLEATVGGTSYLGNVFSGQWSTTGGTADAANNYEGVFLPAGTTGAIEVTVTGFNIAGDGVPNTGDGTDQDFALVCYNCAQNADFTMDATPAAQDICTPDDAAYDVIVGSILGYSASVSLSAAGHPAGTTATFADNPVTSPFTTTLTIGNTGAASFGDYDIDVVGMGPTSTHTATVQLGVYTTTPDPVTLIAPADGATSVDLVPTFEWQAATQGQSYFLEVAEDNAFATVVYSTTVAGTTATPNIALDPLSTYYWRVVPGNICGDGATSAVWSFETRDIPPILLVDDDDNSPDVRSYYTDALDNLGALYDVWDTNNSDNEPTEADLLPYETVIWFTGDEFGGAAGPGAAGEGALGNWLDGGKCLFISSQDYHYDRGLTTFMDTYLGVASVANDSGNYTSVSGQGSVFGGLGPYSLDYGPIGTDYSDEVSPDADAELAFLGGNSNDAAVNKDSGVYRTTFWGYSFEAIAAATDREEAMSTILAWCGTGSAVGTLEGTVTDADSGLGIDGATITTDDGSNQRTTTTDANGDYAINLAVGTYDVTASATNYMSDTVTSISIVTDTVTTQDFALQGSSLTYTPPEIEEFMLIGEMVTNTVTVTNSGPLDVDWNVTIGNYAGPNALNIPASDGNFPQGDAAPSIERAPAGAEGNGAAANGNLPNLLGSLAYGVNLISSDFVSLDTDTPGTLTTIATTAGDFYAGDFLGGDFSVLYAVDDGTATLYAIDTATGGMTAIGSSTPTGGQSWTGMAGDPTDGTMYGWSTDCSANTLYTVDVTTGALTTVGTASGVCIIDIAVNAAGEMYGLDIISDQLMSIDKATGAVTAIGSLGFDANFAQGMDFDEVADTLYLAAYNNATSAGELRIADTNTGGTTLVGPLGAGSGVEMDAFAVATGGGGGTGGWATAVPDTGTIPAGSTATFDVVFDATSIYQVGDYTAELDFSGTFVNDVPTMPLTMHVSCPTCATLNGAITDANTSNPVTADVHIVGDTGLDVTVTGESYEIAAPAGTYTLTASASGYFSQTATVSASSGMTTTTDFALVPIQAVLEYSPPEIEEFMQVGETVTNTVTVTNSGTTELAWNVSIGNFAGPAAVANPVDLPASDGNFPRGAAAPSLDKAPGADGKMGESGNNVAGLQDLLGGGSPAYGVDLLSSNFLSFSTDTPGTATTIGTTAGDFYAGDFLGGDFSTLYAVDNGTMTLYAIDTATAGLTAIGSSSASGGQSWTGLAGDPTSSTMYGWSTDCSANTLYTVDVTTGALTTVGTASGVCIIDIAVNAAGEMYGLDILADELVSIDKATGAVTTIGSLGFDANFAQGMDFDEAAGILYLAAYNNATGAAELRIADTSTGATTLVGPIGAGAGVELDAFAVATGGSGATNWAYAVPDNGTIPAGGTDTFDVVFDATSLTQPGDYTAELEFSGNFVNDVPTMPLTMHLSCPTCGTLNGAITDAFTGNPVTADVHVVGDTGFETTLTGDTYEVAVPAGTYTLTASASGYFSDTATVAATAGMTTTTDFALVPIAALLDYAPDLYEATTYLGGMVTQTMTISNVGTLPFDYELADAEIGSPMTTTQPAAPTVTCPPDAFGYTCIDSNETNGPTYEWMDISGTGTDMGLGDDSHFWPIDLPFDFDFYGTAYNQIAVGSNGTVYFEDTYLGFSNTGIPDSNSYGVDSFIAVYWDDLNPSSAGAVYYEIVGNAPNRMLIVQWQDVPNYGTSDPVTAQAILFEGTNNILVQYLDPSSEAGGGATEGIQGDTSTGLQYGYDEAILTSELAICYVHPDSTDPNCGGAAPANWLHEVPISGTVNAGESMMVDIVFDATVVTQTGTYTAEIYFDGTFDNDVMPATAIMHVEEPMPSVTMMQTLSADGTCGTDQSMTMTWNSDVTFCFTAENTGNVMLTTHWMSDTMHGMMMDGQTFDLAPGETYVYTTTTTMAPPEPPFPHNMQNCADWQSEAAEGTMVMSQSCTDMSITAPTDVSLTGFGSDTSAVATPLWLATVLLAALGLLGIAWRRRLTQ